MTELVNIEKQFLADVISDVINLQRAMDLGITGDYFKITDNKILYEMAKWYFAEHHTMLLDDSLQWIINGAKNLHEDSKKRVLLNYAECKGLVPSSNFDLVLNEFCDYYKKNFMAEALLKTTDKMSSGAIDEAVEALKEKIKSFETKFNPPSVASSFGFFGDDFDRVKAEYEDRQLHPEKYQGVFIGYPGFDGATGGLYKGTVSVIMGRVKSAKSVLALNIAHNVAAQGKTVYYHMNEGGRAMAQNRLISCNTGLPYSLIRDAKLPPDQYAIYLDCLKNSTNKNIILDSVPPVYSNAAYIEGRMEEILKIRPSIDLIIVDHMGLMSPNNRDHQKLQGWEKLGIVSIELKSLAMQYNIPMVVITHVNRRGMSTEDTAFAMEDMSGSIEPLKNVDLIASWRIVDEKVFKTTHKGSGMLSVQGARDATEPDVTLEVNTNIMKISEGVLMAVKHTPAVAETVVPVQGEQNAIG